MNIVCTIVMCLLIECIKQHTTTLASCEEVYTKEIVCFFLESFKFIALLNIIII